MTTTDLDGVVAGFCDGLSKRRPVVVVWSAIDNLIGAMEAMGVAGRSATPHLHEAAEVRERVG